MTFWRFFAALRGLALAIRPAEFPVLTDGVGRCSLDSLSSGFATIAGGL